jgi:hypothetical protein
MAVKNEYEVLDLISAFLTASKEDPRIGSTHISLYTSLVYFWQKQGCDHPLSFFRRDIVPICKISGTATFHKIIKELNDFGYVKYIPSFSRYLGSLVYLMKKNDPAIVKVLTQKW